MKKDLGVKPYTFPMPVLMIATYGADGTVDVMNMAWGGVCAENMVALNIDEDHKTAENIKARGAFTPVSYTHLPCRPDTRRGWRNRSPDPCRCRTHRRCSARRWRSSPGRRHP